MRVGLVRDSEEEIMKFMDGLIKLSIKKVYVKKVQTIDNSINLGS